MHASIMSRGNPVESESERLFEKEIKLHEIVAENIWIRSSPSIVFSVDIVNDSSLIFLLCLPNV